MNAPLCFSAILGSALSLALCGCNKDQQSGQSSNKHDPSPSYVVAMVNSTPLTWKELDKRAMGYMKDDVDYNHLIIPTNRMDEAKDYFRRRSVNAFVFKTVIMDEATKQKVQLTENDRQEGLRTLAETIKARNWTTNDFFAKGPMDAATMHREFEDGLVIDKLLRLKVRDSLKVDNKDITSAIEMIGATNDLRKAQLEQVRKQLLAGAKFEDLAKSVSECPSAQHGGDLGEFTRGKTTEKAFEDAAFKQKVGVIGPIVETQLGYHIIKVTAHTPAHAATASTPAIPESVRVSHILIKRIPVDRKRIVQTLLRAKYNAGVQKYFNELKAQAKIECFLYKDMTF
jgi:peptidyl-prolyl cis-trans isomerase C